MFFGPKDLTISAAERRFKNPQKKGSQSSTSVQLGLFGFKQSCQWSDYGANEPPIFGSRSGLVASNEKTKSHKQTPSRQASWKMWKALFRCKQYNLEAVPSLEPPNHRLGTDSRCVCAMWRRTEPVVSFRRGVEFKGTLFPMVEGRRVSEAAGCTKSCEMFEVMLKPQGRCS